MSSIDKLQIQGVRSFGTGHGETIQFFTPLTLIVGYNGSGKTTIVECLKYVTTGELPPNSKQGGAFIHDPKLCGEKEVLALVSMSFNSTSGAKMVVSRRLMVTVTKSTRKQKALEGNLTLRRDGERTSISTRVAELDQIIPQYLGVSKAILEYVIFCHQDESLWPMSEPAALKKRFDEIFEALKYTKAIDNIKVLRKKQNEELGKMKIIEQHAKEDKNKGERAEKRSRELSEEIERLRVEIEALGSLKKTAAQRSKEAWDHCAKFEKIVATLEGKRIEASAVERSVQDLKKHIKEMTDSDEELQAIEDRYEERMGVYQRDNEVQRRRYQEISKEIEQHRRTLGDKQTEIGKYQAQKDQYERHVQQRETLIKETARRHNIRGFDLDIDNEKVLDFMERIGKMARDQNATFERARRETQDESHNAQKELNQLNERKSAISQSKESARNQITINDRKISSHQAELDKIDVDEGGKATLESTIEDIEQRLARSKADYDTARWERQIQDTDMQLRTLDEKKERLDAELVEGTRQAGDSARLDYLQKELKDRQRNNLPWAGLEP